MRPLAAATTWVASTPSSSEPLRVRISCPPDDMRSRSSMWIVPGSWSPRAELAPDEVRQVRLGIQTHGEVLVRAEGWDAEAEHPPVGRSPSTSRRLSSSGWTRL